VETDAGITGYASAVRGPATCLRSGGRSCWFGRNWRRSCWGSRPPRSAQRRMRRALAGHPYVKARLTWPAGIILGQGGATSGLCASRGGSKGVPALSSDFPKILRKRWPQVGDIGEGYTKFQLKVGGDPDVDICAHSACRQVLQPTTPWSPMPTPAGPCTRRPGCPRSGGDVYIEQPCRTFPECLGCGDGRPPFVLDEIITDMDGCCAALPMGPWIS